VEASTSIAKFNTNTETKAFDAKTHSHKITKYAEKS
jgi:hypothetical protein